MQVLLLMMAWLSQEAYAQTAVVEQIQIQIAGVFDTKNLEWGEELFDFTMAQIQEGGWLSEQIPGLATPEVESAEFSYYVRNANCDSTTAVRAYWDLRSGNPGQLPPHGLVGAYCSGASISLARIAGLEGVPQISPFSTSSRLSDTEEFPYFARMLAADDSRGEVGALVSMLRLYGWDRISILATDSVYAKDWATEFRRLWEGPHEQDSPAWTGEVAYSNTIRIRLDETIDPESVKRALSEAPDKKLKTNSRIILLAAHSQHAFPILEMAAAEGFQPETIWVGPSAWIGKDLTRAEVSSWMPQNPGYLGAIPFRHNNRFHNDFLNLLQREQHDQNRPVWETLPSFGTQLVDSIIALVLGLASVRPSQLRDGDLVMQHIKKLKFDGVSGRVHFTPDGDLKDPQFSILHLKQVHSMEGPRWSSVGSTGTRVGTAKANHENQALCFPGEGCVATLADVPDDSFPVPPLPGWAIALIALFLLLFVLVVVKYWRSRRSKKSIKEELNAFRDSVVGMRTAEAYYIPTISTNSTDDDIEEARETLLVHPQAKIQWCWKETGAYMHVHDAEDIEDAVDCWIKYDDDKNAKLEAAYQSQNGTGHFSPQREYSVSFAAMKQTKTATGFERAVQRLVIAPPTPETGPTTVDLKDTQVGGKLPMNIGKEPQMVLVKGDIVQISKQRPDGWAFGTKLYHEDEAAARALVAHICGGASADEANVFVDTGWFVLDATRIPSAEDLAALQKKVGDTGPLEAPSHWDPVADPTVAQQQNLQKGDPEYDTVVGAFMSTLQNRTIQNIKVNRIQNLAMWQSYVVKRQTICYRETEQSGSEKDKTASGDAIQRKAVERFERRWLWHGTNTEVKDTILQQGFNRSFCGKNATMHGKGVYFARDACYSAYTNYAVPDTKGFQYIMACRVVVGEYCVGKEDALTPGMRDAKSQSLYDSTVGLLTNDSMADPSIYVTYHDAQAYPEYLIKFKQQ